MSSGGFYKFRCKNFLTYNCTNWVYVNNSVCATCCAEGRDGDVVVPAGAAWPLARDVFVPRAEDGMLYYTAMELVAGPGGDQPDWTLRYAAKEPSSSSSSLLPPPPPPPPPPSSQPLGRTVATTSAIPGAPLPATTF